MAATLHRGARASHCGGFSCCGARALGMRASAVVARGLSRCGLQASVVAARGLQELWHMGSVVVARGLSSCGSRALQHRFSSCGARA